MSSPVIEFCRKYKLNQEVENELNIIFSDLNLLLSDKIEESISCLEDCLIPIELRYLFTPEEI